MNAPRPHPHAQPHSHSDSGRALCREDLKSGSLRDAYLQTELADLAWSDAQLQRSLNQTLRCAPRGEPSGDVWIPDQGAVGKNPYIAGWFSTWSAAQRLVE